jgi:formylglycine-generating enzyme required for sulfatase activity
VGVDHYAKLPAEAQLSGAVKDARLIAETLGTLDPPFEVTLLADVGQRDATSALLDFTERARGAECALIYFAGHGVEYHGENFLLVNDTELGIASADVARMKRRLGTAALSLQVLVDELDATEAQVKVVILDACRDNPLQVEDESGTRSLVGGRRGLAQVTPPSGSLISYSADAGQQANDGLFTRVLAKHLRTPGLPLLEVFAATREEVVATSTKMATEGLGVRHEPAEYTKLNLAGTKFSFTRPEPVVDRTEEILSASAAEMDRLKQALAEAQEKLAAATPTVVAQIQRAVPIPPEELAVVVDETSGVTAGELRMFGGIEMVWCPPGAFIMGSPLQEWDRQLDEVPHWVTLSRGYWLARTECTQSQWAAVMGTTVDQQRASGEAFGEVSGRGPQHPMVFVSWQDAQTWVEQMNAMAPLPGEWHWALPTEAQWEQACRAGSETAYNTGERITSQDANFDAAYSVGQGFPGTYLGTSATVGRYSPNAWGLFDMHGNVLEWCADWYGAYPGEPVRDPRGSLFGTHRVLRGGGWNNVAADCRSAYRYGGVPELLNFQLGFRPAIVLNSESGAVAH